MAQSYLLAKHFMTNSSSQLRLICGVGVLALLAGSTGCSTLLGKTKGPLDNLDVTQMKMAGYSVGAYGANKPLPLEEGSNAIVLEVVNGKRSFEKVPMVPGQPLFVADLMRDTDMYKKVGRTNVVVLRPNGNRPPVRLDVDFDASGKNVMEGQNYSLRPGDHVVVTPNDRSWIASMIGETVFSKKK